MKIMCDCDEEMQPLKGAGVTLEYQCLNPGCSVAGVQVIGSPYSKRIFLRVFRRDQPDVLDHPTH